MLPPPPLTEAVRVEEADAVISTPPVPLVTVDARLADPPAASSLTRAVPAPPLALMSEPAVTASAAPAPVRLTVTSPPLVVMSLAMVPDPVEVMDRGPPDVVTGPNAEKVAAFRENDPPPVATAPVPNVASATAVMVRSPPLVWTVSIRSMPRPVMETGAFCAVMEPPAFEMALPTPPRLVSAVMVTGPLADTAPASVT